MKKLRRLVFALSFFLDPDALAVTDTWDGNGGTGANNNFSNNLNWLDDTAPSSDLVNTDLIFATTNKLTPNVSVALSAHSIIFDNTSGAFSIGGLALSIGTGGIRNDDADTQTFTNTVDFSGVATATISAASGPLTFTNTVTLPTTALTVGGGNPTSFANISGATGLTKGGAGMMTWAPSINTSFDITLNNGSITTVADGSMDVFTNFSDVVVNNPAVFNAQEDIRLSGAHFSLTGPLTQLNVASGKILTIESGGTLDITDGAADLSVSNMVVTGSTSSVTAINLLFGNSGTFAISAGADVTVTGNLFIGTFGDGSLTLNGSGSTLSGAITKIARSGLDGTLTFAAGSSGTLGALELGDGGSSNSNGILNIQSASVVHATGLVVAGDAGNATCTGVVTVTGSGSLLTLDGAATATIGSATGSVGTLNVQNSGTFGSGTGLTTVNATGTIAVTDGVYTSHGGLTLNGGQLSRDATGVFGIDAGKTFTIQAGGDAVFTGAFTNSTPSTITVTGSFSTLTTTSTLSINGGSSLNVQSGGRVDPGSTFSAGVNGNGIVSVDGSLSTLIGPSGCVMGAAGFSGTAIFSNGGQGNFAGGTIDMSNSTTANSDSSLSIQSGSTVLADALNVGFAVGSNTANVSVAGAGSLLLIGGSATIGAASSSTALVVIASGAELRSGVGSIAINATGALTVQAGGNLTAAWSSFSGTGAINLAGNYFVGGNNQTHPVSFAQNILLQSTSSITMEIRGTVAGSNYDQIHFNGSGTPQVAWNGALNLVLGNGFVPQVENAFNLFDFDSARDSGAFSSVAVPALPGGLFWRLDNLYNSGVVRISKTADTYAQWQTTFGSGAFTADDDHDGVPNGVEFLLGTNPEVAGVGSPLAELAPVVGANVTTGVTFTIPVDPGPDAHYRVQASPDLVGWTTIASKDGSGAWSGSASVTTGLVVAGLTSITVNETLPLGTTKRFHRLQAISP